MLASYQHLAGYVGRALGLSDRELDGAFRPAREDEIPALLALRRQVGGDMWWDDERFVRWRYFTRGAESGESLCWVFVREGRALGACGIEPVTLVVGGEAREAVRSLDIMVSPELDGLGLGAFMNLALFRRFPVVLVTGSNERSHRLLTRMFDHATDLHMWKTPLRAPAVLDRYAVPRPVEALAAPLVDAALRIRRGLARVRRRGAVVMRPIEAFDSTVTEMCRRCERDDVFIVRRSGEYLNWRFADNPRCRYRMLGAYRDGRLVGYAVTRLNLRRPNPRWMGEVVDWLAEPDAVADVLPALVQTGVNELARDGAGLVTLAATERAARGATIPELQRRSGEHIPFFVRSADPDLHSRLRAGDAWFVTRGDLDVE